MAPKPPDVIVVGGGVIGCAVAYYLACEGLAVTVLDRGEIGGEASRAAAGMLAPLAEAKEAGPFLDLGLASLRLYPETAAELKQVSGVDIEYLPSGILRVALSDAEAERLRDAAWGAPAGVELHWLEVDELRAMEPAASPAARGALYSPQEHQVNADRLVQAFAKAAAVKGVFLRPDSRVTSLIANGNAVGGVRTTNESLHAGDVVLAAGAWTAQIARRSGIDVPVFPVRGQMAALPASRSFLRHILWGEDGYLVPKANGLVFAGATVERVGFRRRVTAAGLRRLRRMSRRMAPRLGVVDPVDAWAGLRPGSADGLPVLGPVPGWEGLTVAAGHYRNGILLAPVTGRLIARSIIDGSSNEALAPFSLARFSRGRTRRHP